MPELNLHQIEQITLEINRQEITFSHLADELIDHLCCDVENEMQNGLDFNDAYKKVKQKIGPRRMKEIQEETLYAIDTKYRIMKNIMKISGVAGTILLGFGAMLKIQHFAGAGILLTLGALTLAFFFLPSSLGVLWKETHNKKSLFLFISAFIAGVLFIFGTLFKVQHWPNAGIVVLCAAFSAVFLFIPALLVTKLRNPENRGKRPIYILGAVGLIFWVTGMLFKINHWPMAAILMILGAIIMSFIVFPWYTRSAWKEESNVDARFIFMVIGAILIVVPGMLFNLNLQRRYTDKFFSFMEQQQLLFSYKLSYNLSRIEQYKDSTSYPVMEKIHNETKGLLNFVSNIQTKMVIGSEYRTDGSEPAPDLIKHTETGTEIQLTRIEKPFTTDAVKAYLYPETSSRKELNLALSEYLNSLSNLTSAELVRKYKELLTPSTFLPSESPGDFNMSLISGLHSLELLKNSILTVESNILTAAAAK